MSSLLDRKWFQVLIIPAITVLSYMYKQEYNEEQKKFNKLGFVGRMLYYFKQTGE